MICRCCCIDTHLMNVSRHVCVRARARACACNERVHVHGFCVCERLCVRRMRVCSARICVRPRVCACLFRRAFLSAHLRVHFVHCHRIAFSRAIVFDVCVCAVNACVCRGAVRAFPWPGKDRR